MIKSDDKELIGPSLESHFCCNTFILLNYSPCYIRTEKNEKNSKNMGNNIEIAEICIRDEYIVF